MRAPSALNVAAINAARLRPKSSGGMLAGCRRRRVNAVLRGRVFRDALIGIEIMSGIGARCRYFEGHGETSIDACKISARRVRLHGNGAGRRAAWLAMAAA